MAAFRRCDLSEAFNQSTLEAWLAREIESFRGPLAVRRLSGGQSNPTFLLATPDRNYVLRKKPDGALLPSAHAIDREYRVMRALERTDVPVPRMLGYCDDTNSYWGRILRHGARRGPDLLGSDPPGFVARRSGSRLRSDEQSDRGAAQRRSDGHWPRRLRPAGALYRAAGRTLEQTISCLRNPANRGHEQVDRLAAEAFAGAGDNFGRSWRP